MEAAEKADVKKASHIEVMLFKISGNSLIRGVSAEMRIVQGWFAIALCFFAVVILFTSILLSKISPR